MYRLLPYKPLKPRKHKGLLKTQFLKENFHIMNGKRWHDDSPEDRECR